MAIFTARHGTVKLKDATGTPIQVTLTPGAGNFTCDGLEEDNCEAIAIYNRGDFLELVKGQDKQVTGAINIFQDGALTSGSEKPLDGVMKTGAFVAGVTQDPGGQVWTTDIEWTGSRAGTTAVITLNNCRVSLGFAESGEGNGLAFSYTCFQGAAIT